MRSLCQLLVEPENPAALVARRWDSAARRDRVVHRGEFQQQVAALRDRIAAGPEGAWVLLTEDAYAFAVGLLALWHSGRHAISPPNHQLGSLRVLQTRGAGVLSDRPDWFGEGGCVDVLAPPTTGAPLGPREPAGFGPLERDALAIELYTSGTTGAEKPVTKRIRHLDDEVRELHATWGSRIGASTFFTTASHQHLYGLLFGVLWPLCAGRPFQADHFLHMRELVPRMRERGDCLLAGVPTHLKRLARHSEAATLRGHCHTVFSSGGPLAREDARAVARVLGHAPLEVLGSTETGGIAWRAQEPGGEELPWTPLRAVRVTRDPDSGVARVRSPFVSVDEAGEGFATGDRIALQPDGRFVMEGRSDRIVKVGEKRLDLAQMESQLRGHPWVAEVALATVDRESELRVAAAVVPSERGWEELQRNGRPAFHRALTGLLAENWDPVLHPRQWRTVARLPENAQGKVTQAALAPLFDAPAADEGHGDVSEWQSASADRPEVLGEVREGDTLERSCRVPPDLSCFPGHFPEGALVPGVLQLDWAMELAAALMGEPPRVGEIESLKLLEPLLPGARFRIRARAARGRVEFRLWSDGCEYARGRVRLGSAPRRDS